MFVMGRRSLVALSCAVLCVSMTQAFAPLALAPTSKRAQARTAARESVGLRAARCTAASVSRRDAVGRTLSLLGGAAVVGALPAVSIAKPTKATKEDTVAAWNKLVDAQESLVDVKTYVDAKDWDGLIELLGKDEFVNMEENLLKIVNGPVLNADDKKTIGTRKRYGIAADVIYGIGGVKGSIANIDNPQIESCKSGSCSGKFVSVDEEVPKALASLKASLSEILQLCKPYKDFVRSE